MKIHNQTTHLPWHPTRRWSKRELSQIDKLIIHQELGEGTIEEVNAYHIHPNHLSPKGCPHFCYHYGIEKNGDILQVNELSDITWHTAGENSNAIGIMLAGNYAGPGHHLATPKPPTTQLDALDWLCNQLLKDFGWNNNNIFGHCHFGKPACPGSAVQKWIEKRWDQEQKKEVNLDIDKTIENIQSILRKLGYSPGPVDGIMGLKTQAAIRRFQAEHGLEVDGIVGVVTWEALVEAGSK